MPSSLVRLTVKFATPSNVSQLEANSCSGSTAQSSSVIAESALVFTVITSLFDVGCANTRRKKALKQS